jgi:hypothetical protein
MLITRARPFSGAMAPSFTQNGARLNVRSPFSRQLAGLFVPEAPGGMLGRVATTARADVFNLAYASQPGIGVQPLAFYTRSGSGGAANKPDVRTDSFGPYWDFPDTGRRFRLSSGSEDMWWRPGNSGGHAPGTLMFVGRLTGNTGGVQCAIGFSANSANYFFLGFNNGNAYAQIRTNTERAFNSSALTVGNPVCVIFTTRAHNDHELVTLDLRTGSRTSNSGTLSSGTAGTVPANYGIGFNTGTGDTHIMSQGRIYLAAGWARGMAADEMIALASDPWQIVASNPHLRRRRYSAAAPPNPGGFRPRVTILG